MANIHFVVAVCLLFGLSTGQDAAVSDPQKPEGRAMALDSTALPGFGQPRPRMAFDIEVAFTAKSPIDIDQDLCLIYMGVVTNIGDAYDPSTGVFIAPVPGVYYFSFTSVDMPGVALYRNREEIVCVNSPNYRYYPVSGSNSAVLWLQEGDRVNICSHLGKRFSSFGNGCSTFSGFLLRPWYRQ